MNRPVTALTRLPTSSTYEVGHGKPPEATRFKPGQSGNPKGRPKGSRNAKPSLAEERIKTLIMEEAYRTIPVLDKGRPVTIPMMTAVLRAVATNAAKGNNRAATLFTTLVGKVEAENRQLASESFGSAIDYKQIWSKELDRRKRLGLKLPDPIPHPDDIILDARNMSFRIVGPWTKDDIPRYKLGADLLLAYTEANEELQQKLTSTPEGPGRDKLCRTIKVNAEHIDKLKPLFGPRHERTKDPVIREIEGIVGQELDLGEGDDQKV